MGAKKRRGYCSRKEITQPVSNYYYCVGEDDHVLEMTLVYCFGDKTSKKGNKPIVFPKIICLKILFVYIFVGTTSLLHKKTTRKELGEMVVHLLHIVFSIINNII